jgi:hypothetical protein
MEIAGPFKTVELSGFKNKIEQGGGKFFPLEST